jgi:hypothetical protein
MEREIKIAIKKVRSELKVTTDEVKKSILRSELKRLKSLVHKEKLAS